jgi:hypothetical protein
MKTITAMVSALLALGLLAPATRAEEAKTPISGPLILNMFAPSVERRDAAFDQSLKEPGPAPRAFGEGEVLPDGSVRYGSGPRAITVTVRNPCPPGTDHYEPPPLPGRRARN